MDIAITMPWVQQMFIASNTPPQQEQTHCNCTRKIGPCPLEGDCRKEKSCIYTCKVTRQDTMESETYTGLTAGTFKGRYYGHNRSFNIREAKQTTLSRHCWNLKDKKIPFDRKWTILTHAKPYNPVTKVCRLCMKEVFYTQRQLHSTKRMKFLDGVNTVSIGHFQNPEEKNPLSIIPFLNQ